jgi:hypothetical protein
MKIFVLCQEHIDVETLFLEVAKAEAVIRLPVSRGTTLFPTSVYVGLVVVTVALGEVFLRDIGFPLSTSFYKFSILIFHSLTLYNPSK